MLEAALIIKARGKEGFTLLEVLVCLVIIGISFTVLFQGLSRSKQISWQAHDTLEAIQIAHNVFNDRRLIREAIDEGEVQGEAKDNKQWSYILEAEELSLKLDLSQEPTIIPSIYKISLKIIHKGQVGKKSYSLVKWIAK